MLAGLDSSYLDVEGRAAVATGNDDGLTGEGSEGLEDGTTELLQGGDVVRWDGVRDAVGFRYIGFFEFFQSEVFGELDGCFHCSVIFSYTVLIQILRFVQDDRVLASGCRGCLGGSGLHQ